MNLDSLNQFCLSYQFFPNFLYRSNRHLDQNNNDVTKDMEKMTSNIRFKDIVIESPIEVSVIYQDDSLIIETKNVKCRLSKITTTPTSTHV